MKSGVIRCFRNTGQSCNAPSRMMVERSRYDQAVEQAIAAAESRDGGTRRRGRPPYRPRGQRGAVRQDPGADPDRTSTRARGLSPAAPGGPATSIAGSYIRPTVFADVDARNDDLPRGDLRARFLAILPFEDEEHAIAMANDTEYGAERTTSRRATRTNLRRVAAPRALGEWSRATERASRKARLWRVQAVRKRARGRGVRPARFSSRSRRCSDWE